MLFNSGIELSDITDPVVVGRKKRLTLFPRRYAYFRDNDFYVIGKKLFSKEDQRLSQFLATEEKRAEKDTSFHPFIDMGAPMKEGALDTNFIRIHGLHVPDEGYVALGDNYSMSLDSRIFGFVPENNLQGSPVFLFWPFGERFGRPAQPEIPFLRIQNLYVWGLAGIILLVSYVYMRRKSSYAAYLKQKQEE